ncbi:MAG: HAD hydrolase family protein [Treponema sp.]|nr:HAD hydrolase family protein [Treponema sp.]
MLHNKIHFLILDVDGTLTDGKIYMGQSGELFKAFDIKDGLGIHDLLPKIGIIPVIITGRNSIIVANRCAELGIKNLFQGVSDKIMCLKEFLEKQDYGIETVAYMGDDINDLECMELVKSAGGFCACPVDAVTKVKNMCDFVSSKTGGNGAVREFIEYIIKME